MSTTADEGRTPPPRRPPVTPDHEHDPDSWDSPGQPARDDDRDRYDRHDDEDDEPYERSSIADVREAAKVPIRHIFTRFWPDTKPFRGRMFLSLLLVAVGPALGTLNIYLFKVLIDDIITPQDFRLFPLVAGAFLAITVVGGLINFGDEYMTAWVGEKFVMGLRQRVFDHMHRLSTGYFESRQLGDLLSRLTGDVASIEALMLSGVNMALTYSFQIVFYAGAMFILNWQLTLAALVAAPIFLLIARSFARRIQSAARESRRRAGSISAVAEESFGNVALVQAYDRADHESRRFRDQNLGNFRAQMRAIKIEGLFSPISAFVESVGTLVVIGIGVWELSQNRITLGGLLVFLAYISQLYGPVQGFAGLTNSIFAASASAERIIEVLDAKPGVEEPAKPVRIGRARGDIRITGLEFGYPGTDLTALHDVDLDIAAGTKVAVVGASGAGKSTLTKLLLRTYDPDAGTITLDDVDLRDLTLTDLRRNITAVLQETLVFDGSIADNIRWGRPDATDEDVATAAAAADAHDFVLRLPDGYDTRIGQRGRMLSGGQRQRIAIARAMIRDAPVLLLDEPTTGLDAESTRRVLEPLRRLMDGRTTVIISHNLITVTDADEIVYVEDGTISARGSHEELLAASPGYAHLYRLHHPDDDNAVPPAPSAPTLEKAPAALRPVPRPAAAATQPDRRDHDDTTGPVPVPFRRPEHVEPPAPRRYVAMPVAGGAPPVPRRVADEPRERFAVRPAVHANARSARDVEETSLLGSALRRPVPGPGGASEWAPGTPAPRHDRRPRPSDGEPHGSGLHGSGDGLRGSGDGLRGSGDGLRGSGDGLRGSGDGLRGSGDGLRGSGDGLR
ncbi:ABC transporter transmembrane domain-containing protein, partial [Pseudonocardia sp.]|uniref:ABC transporter ATP-binding protein n=3 Tax=Pseudonocardia sp. TaxID=60912 RepID=UPI003D12F21A